MASQGERATKTPHPESTFAKASAQGKLAIVIATALGSGYGPIAPGTWGTALAVPFAFAMAGLPLWIFALVTAATIVIGIWAANRADEHWRTHDAGRIVIDEVAGYFVTVAFVDRSEWVILLTGFFVFRAFDIIKPPPVRAIDRHLQGGVGVVLDDVAAGALGALVMVGLDALGAFDALISRL